MPRDDTPANDASVTPDAFTPDGGGSPAGPLPAQTGRPDRGAAGARLPRLKAGPRAGRLAGVLSAVVLVAAGGGGGGG
ncbi:hypothetical protein, partial [Arthrobacter sp. PsM3]|uniref:hypothetical protein n=1 Tax=Arthrobacter sp. PsM3 TaxID=3030531 RepID=UPI00263BE455